MRPLRSFQNIDEMVSKPLLDKWSDGSVLNNNLTCLSSSSSHGSGILVAFQFFIGPFVSTWNTYKLKEGFCVSIWRTVSTLKYVMSTKQVFSLKWFKVLTRFIAIRRHSSFILSYVSLTITCQYILSKISYLHSDTNLLVFRYGIHLSKFYWDSFLLSTHQLLLSIAEQIFIRCTSWGDIAF